MKTLWQGVDAYGNQLTIKQDGEQLLVGSGMGMFPVKVDLTSAREAAAAVLQSNTTPDRKVTGSCPMGCGETLFLGSGGYVTCSLIACPKPDAASDVLRSLGKTVATREQNIATIQTFNNLLIDAYFAAGAQLCREIAKSVAATKQVRR